MAGLGSGGSRTRSGEEGGVPEGKEAQRGLVVWMMEAGGVTSALGFGVWSSRHPKPCWQVSLSGPKTQAPSKRDKQEPTKHPGSAWGTRSQELPVSLENRTGAVLPPPRGQSFGVKEACAGCRQKRGLKTSGRTGLPERWKPSFQFSCSQPCWLRSSLWGRSWQTFPVKGQGSEV